MKELVIGDVIAVREKHPADPAHALQALDQRLGEARRVHQHVALGPYDQVARRAEAVGRGIAAVIDVLGDRIGKAGHGADGPAGGDGGNGQGGAIYNAGTLVIRGSTFLSAGDVTANAIGRPGGAGFEGGSGGGERGPGGPGGAGPTLNNFGPPGRPGNDGKPGNRGNLGRPGRAVGPDVFIGP